MGGAGVDERRFRTLSEFSQISKNQKQKHTTVRIRWWSPTQLLTHRRVA
jgi:hypothetical protein